MIVVIVLLSALVLIEAVWLVFEYKFSTEAAAHTKEALDGWKKAIELHEKDRETFVGQKYLADKWPETIEK